MISPLAWFYWDPEGDLFTIPWFNHSVRWYGLCFALGFMVGYFIIIRLFRQQILFHTKLNAESAKKQSIDLIDRLSWFVVAGTIVGARLGHVFFYEWSRYKHHLIDIFKVWEGGLASHGGALGLLIALCFYQRIILKQAPWLSLKTLMDMIVIPTALVAVFIRLGNFINQEILGTPTSLPWGVIFGHPIDGGPLIPRHPVQLYEAGCYLLIFLSLIWLWRRKGPLLPQGLLSGLFLILLFTSRFFLEYLKVPQEAFFNEQSYFNMGQLLSLPFIIWGFTLLVQTRLKSLNSC